MREFTGAILSLPAVLTLAGVALAGDNPCGEKAMNPCNPCAKNAHYFHVEDPMGRNSISFTSTAPLEDIVGVSREITGYVTFNPEQPGEGGHGELSVPVASLNTGIPLRDEHLQSEDWLNAEKHPVIILTIDKIKSIEEVKSGDGFQTYDVVIVGDLLIHGQTKRMEIPGRFTYLKESHETKAAMPGDLLAVRAEFDVNLDDFDVTGPKGMGIIGAKVGKSIAVKISFRASSASMGSMAENPCNPCGGKK